MARILTRWEGDTPFSDLLLWAGVDMWQSTTSGTAPTLTRTAAGNYSLSAPAGQTTNFFCSLSTLMQRTGYVPLTQEQFGGTYGPGPSQGYPPFKGAAQLTPPSAFFPKGIQINNIVLCYGIATANLTSQTFTLNSTLFANATAPAVTNIPVTGTLATTFAATPYATKLTVTTPAFTVADLTELSIDNIVITPASSVYSLYGAFVHCTFNLA